MLRDLAVLICAGPSSVLSIKLAQVVVRLPPIFSPHFLSFSGGRIVLSTPFGSCHSRMCVHTGSVHVCTYVCMMVCARVCVHCGCVCMCTGVYVCNRVYMHGCVYRCAYCVCMGVCTRATGGVHWVLVCTGGVYWVRVHGCVPLACGRVHWVCPGCVRMGVCAWVCPGCMHMCTQVCVHGCVSWVRACVHSVCGLCTGCVSTCAWVCVHGCVSWVHARVHGCVCMWCVGVPMGVCAWVCPGCMCTGVCALVWVCALGVCPGCVCVCAQVCVLGACALGVWVCAHGCVCTECRHRGVYWCVCARIEVCTHLGVYTGACLCVWPHVLSLPRALLLCNQHPAVLSSERLLRSDQVLPLFNSCPVPLVAVP